jgi:hypothetical protein
MLKCILCGSVLSDPDLCSQCGSLEGLDDQAELPTACLLRLADIFATDMPNAGSDWRGVDVVATEFREYTQNRPPFTRTACARTALQHCVCILGSCTRKLIRCCELTRESTGRCKEGVMKVMDHGLTLSRVFHFRSLSTGRCCVAGTITSSFHVLRSQVAVSITPAAAERRNVTRTPNMA